MLSLGNFDARDRIGGIFFGLSKGTTEQNGPSDRCCLFILLSHATTFPMLDLTSFVY